jgi:hypothetical protein
MHRTYSTDPRISAFPYPQTPYPGLQTPDIKLELTILILVILRAVHMPVPDLESFGDRLDALVAFGEVDAVPEGRHLGAGVQGGGGLEGERHDSERGVCGG